MKGLGSSIWSKLTVLLAGFASILIFTWPLYVSTEAASEVNLAQAVFIALMPMLLILVLVEVSSGSIGSKQLALLGVLIALNAVIRLLGAGTAGVETAFFLIIISGYVFGSGFGFLLGTGSLLVSALLTGGVGPWLPFQMMAAGLMGIGAGLLPKITGKLSRVILLMVYAIPASFFYGALMTMWNWPFLAGEGSSISHIAGAGVVENLLRFFQYQLLTGGLLWDFGRAITTSLLIAVSGPLLLSTLQRAASKSGFATNASSVTANRVRGQ